MLTRKQNWEQITKAKILTRNQNVLSPRLASKSNEKTTLLPLFVHPHQLLTCGLVLFRLVKMRFDNGYKHNTTISRKRQRFWTRAFL